jgi:hypothetical protein
VLLCHRCRPRLEGPEFEWQCKDAALRHATSTRESGTQHAWLQRCSPLSVLSELQPEQQPYHSRIIHVARIAIGNQPFVQCTVTLHPPARRRRRKFSAIGREAKILQNSALETRPRGV